MMHARRVLLSRARRMQSQAAPAAEAGVEKSSRIKVPWIPLIVGSVVYFFWDRSVEDDAEDAAAESLGAQRADINDLVAASWLTPLELRELAAAAKDTAQVDLLGLQLCTTLRGLRARRPANSEFLVSKEDLAIASGRPKKFVNSDESLLLYQPGEWANRQEELVRPWNEWETLTLFTKARAQPHHGQVQLHERDVQVALSLLDAASVDDTLEEASAAFDLGEVSSDEEREQLTKLLAHMRRIDLAWDAFGRSSMSRETLAEFLDDLLRLGHFRAAAMTHRDAYLPPRYSRVTGNDLAREYFAALGEPESVSLTDLKKLWFDNARIKWYHFWKSEVTTPFYASLDEIDYWRRRAEQVQRSRERRAKKLAEVAAQSGAE